MLPGTTGGAWAVSCADATDCTVAGGDYGTNKAFYDQETGGVWSSAVEVTSPGTTGLFYGVSCYDATHCMAVGYDEGTNEPFYDFLGPSTSTTTTGSSHSTSTTSTTSTTTTIAPTTTTTLHVTPTKPPSLGATVGFPTGGAILSKGDEVTIQKFLSTMVRERLHVVTVSGFASPEGSSRENATLIVQRAASVARFIQQTLRREHVKDIVVRVNIGGIKHLAMQLSDQVATLSA